MIIVISYAYYSLQCARHVLSTLHTLSHVIVTTNLGGMHCYISVLQTKNTKLREMKELVPGYMVTE